MDKKKIYIIIIIVCVAITAGVLYWSSQDQSAGLPNNIAPINTDINSADPASSGRNSATAGLLPAPDATESYGVPRVFPQDTQLNIGVFESSKFSGLTDYVPLTVPSEQVGRENPFLNY